MTTFIDMSWKVDEDRRKREAAAAACNGAAEQEPLLQRLGLWQKTKEFFRPELRKKRALEEFAIAQRLQEGVNEPNLPPSLSGAGSEALEDHEETASLSDDEEITALPPMPGSQNTTPARRPARRPASLAPQDGMQESSSEDEADRAMDEALAAADSPGNRYSTRPSLPAHWMTTPPGPLRTTMSDSSLRVSTRQAEFLPLPSAVFSPGSVPLPSFAEFSVMEGRFAAARGEEDGGDDAKRDTPTLRR